MILLLVGAVVLAAVVAAARHRYRLVTVTGHSMVPALHPGDRVLVRRLRRSATVPVGQLVVARKPWAGYSWTDPQPGPTDGATWLVKRVAAGDAPPGSVILLGDNPVRSWDSRQWGPCPADRILGVVVRVFPAAATQGPAVSRQR